MIYYPGVTLEMQLAAFREQYLDRKGWPQSFEQRSSIDHQGPVPWITYPAIEFLKRTVRPEWRVFEFGTGFSTAWWSSRVTEVQTVDHDAEWSSRVAPLCRPNVTFSHVPVNIEPGAETARRMERYFVEVPEPPPPPDAGFRFRAGLESKAFRAYAGRILEAGDIPFDVVVIDGMARSLATWLTVHYSPPRAFLLFDNSDRPEYEPAYAILRGAGYRRIDFWGPGPINAYEWCTSVFLRSVESLP